MPPKFVSGILLVIYLPLSPGLESGQSESLNILSGTPKTCKKGAVLTTLAVLCSQRKSLVYLVILSIPHKEVSKSAKYREIIIKQS